MARVKVSYALTRRPSQSRIAAAYQDILRDRYDLIGAQDDADVVIVHHPPRNYETVYALHPALKRKYVIAACVAHASDIPAQWRRNLALVQEVWTCSRFCREVLGQYHPKVTLVPYVIERDFACTETAMRCVERLIGFDERAVYFLNISPLDEPRKNVRELVECFLRVAGEIPRARLIVKGASAAAPGWLPSDHRVLLLPFQMPAEYISALYRLAHVYVSPHHAESWGITMSDAMLCGKPVIATGYSGNLEYMDEASSFLLPFREGVVAAEAPSVGVEAGARWADPDLASLEDAFRRLYAEHASEETALLVRRAREAVRRFDRPHVAAIIGRSIDEAVG